MNDVNGRLVALGDKVAIGGGIVGIVVCSIDTDEYASGFPKDEWEYLGRGIVVQTAHAGLVHLEGPNEDTEIILPGAG